MIPQKRFNVVFTTIYTTVGHALQTFGCWISRNTYFISGNRAVHANLDIQSNTSLEEGIVTLLEKGCAYQLWFDDPVK